MLSFSFVFRRTKNEAGTTSFVLRSWFLVSFSFGLGFVNRNKRNKKNTHVAWFAFPAHTFQCLPVAACLHILDWMDLNPSTKDSSLQVRSRCCVASTRIIKFQDAMQDPRTPARGGTSSTGCRASGSPLRCFGLMKLAYLADSTNRHYVVVVPHCTNTFSETSGCMYFHVTHHDDKVDFWTPDKHTKCNVT